MLIVERDYNHILHGRIICLVLCRRKKQRLVTLHMHVAFYSIEGYSEVQITLLAPLAQLGESCLSFILSSAWEDVNCQHL